MADETLLVDLNIGGDSTDAQSAVADVSTLIAGLQGDIDSVNAANIAAISEAGSQAEGGLTDAGAAAAALQGDLDGAGSSASSAAGELSGAGSAGHDAEGGLHGASEGAKELLGSLGGANSGLGEMTGALTEVGEGVMALAEGPAGFAVLGAAAAGAFFEIGSGALDAANQMLHLESTTGMSQEGVEYWSAAMSDAGSSADSLNKYAIKLDSAISDMASGSMNNASKALAGLGISATDSEGNLRTFEEVFPDVIQALQGMDETQQRATASAIFGKRAVGDLLPLIANYGEISGVATDQVHRFGIENQDLASTAIAGNIAQTNLNMQIERLEAQLGPPFVAVLSAMANGLETFTTDVGEANDMLETLTGSGLGDFITNLTGVDKLISNVNIVTDVAHGNFGKLPGDFRDAAESLPGLGLGITGVDNAVGSLSLSLVGGSNSLDWAIEQAKAKAAEMNEALATDSLGVATSVGGMRDSVTRDIDAMNQVVSGGMDADSLAIQKLKLDTLHESNEMSQAWGAYQREIAGDLSAHEQDIRGVFPTMNEEFDKWSERLHEQRKNYDNFQTNLQTIMDALVAAHVKAPQDIITELDKAGPDVTAHMAADLAQGGYDAVAQTLDDMGHLAQGVPTDMVDGVNRTSPDWIERMNKLGQDGHSAVVTGIGDTSAIGADAVNGIVHGLEQTRWRVHDEAVALGLLIPNSVKGVLDAQSPSRVMMGVGRDVTQGLVMGIQGGFPDISRAGVGMANALMGGGGQGQSSSGGWADYGRRAGGEFGQGWIAGFITSVGSGSPAAPATPSPVAGGAGRPNHSPAHQAFLDQWWTNYFAGGGILPGGLTHGVGRDVLHPSAVPTGPHAGAGGGGGDTHIHVTYIHQGPQFGDEIEMQRAIQQIGPAIRVYLGAVTA
jgi:hypothetical protein